MSQKAVFLSGEGDKWLIRNKKEISNRDYNNDIVSIEILKIIKEHYKNKRIRILEVGCGNSTRLKKLKKRNVDCFGVDPSDLSVAESKRNKIYCKKGTADKIPFNSNYFDIVIFGFCLYVCDESDYKKIKKETLRITKKNSFIIIQDFYSPKKIKKKFKYNKKISVIKQDFTKIFIDKKIKLISRKIVDYLSQKYTKRKNMWSSVDTLIKFK